MKNILIVDDDSEVSRSLANLFDSERYRFYFLEDGPKMVEFLSEHKDIDAVLLDVNLPTVSGLDLLKKCKENGISVPVIMISGHISTENAMEAMREGAFEYLTKPFEIQKLIDTVNKACGRRRHKLKTTKDDLDPHPLELDEIVGKSPEIVEIAKLIGQVAKSDAAVLIFGESGTGKELVARAIHRNSRRRNKACLSVNCAALAETLLESELFGHEKGAFTGAYYKRLGKFEQANGGTIFLDEIADMSTMTQSKLLRVLQEKKIERVGGNDTIDVDVRIVAATNKSLVQCMKEGSFRVDLFYRLKVVSIYMPPLRERKGDIPLLVDHFIDKYSDKVGKEISGISTEAIRMLSKYPWPGNIRELENNIQTACVMTKNGTLQPEDFPIYSDIDSKIEINLDTLQEDYIEIFSKIIDPVLPKLINSSEGKIYYFLESALEKALISACLKYFGSNQVKTSEMLGISRNTLRDRISRYSIY
ncbi:MAG TPA: sigma-54-dependent Fis family transcriptional regulator [candidate division Zixibacteria bacterium]|nr:sigma-54-dependent Fis family transcriptional regulator [candidate division Zixibacteria bacterium]